MIRLSVTLSEPAVISALYLMAVQRQRIQALYLQFRRKKAE